MTGDLVLPVHPSKEVGSPSHRRRPTVRDRYRRLSDWLAPLFPEAAPDDRRRRIIDVVIPTLLVAVSPAVMLARVGGLSAVNTIWAEDGSVFMSRAWRGHDLGSLHEPYAGYMLLWQRVLGSIGTLFTLDSAASYYAWASALSVGLCAAFVYAASVGHVRSRPVRLVLALSVMFIPAAVTESAEVVANVQWFMIAALFWVLLWRPRTRFGLVAGSFLLFLSVTSSPLCLLLAPLAVARWIGTRALRDRIFVGAYALGALTQVAVMLTTSRPHAPLPTAGDVAQSYGARIVLGTFDGIQDTGVDFKHFGWAAVAFCGVLLLGAIALASTSREGRRFAAVAVAGSVILFGFSATYSWSPVMRPTRDQLALPIATRYSMGPIMLLFGLLAVALSRRPARFPRVIVPVLGVLVLAQLSRGAVTDFSTVTYRAAGPLWAQTLATARATCLHEPADRVVKLPVGPALNPPVFVVDNVTCADLRQ